MKRVFVLSVENGSTVTQWMVIQMDAIFRATTDHSLKRWPHIHLDDLISKDEGTSDSKTIYPFEITLFQPLKEEKTERI